MRLLDLMEHWQGQSEGEYDCPCCDQQYCSATDRFDHVLKSHARDFDETREILENAMMPLFDAHYVSGEDDVKYIGVSNDDHTALLADDGDALGQILSEE